MKKVYLLFFFLVLYINNDLLSQNPISGQWRFISYRNKKSHYFKVQKYFTYRYGSIMLEFTDSANYGKIKGHTICNNITAEYQLIDDSTILFSKVTRGLFPEKYEIMDIRRGLKGKTNYIIDENSLRIVFNYGKEELNFLRVSYELSGTWRVKQIIDIEEKNPNVSYDEKLRFELGDDMMRIFNVDEQKKDIIRDIIQTNLFHKFEIDPIKNPEIKNNNLDPILLSIFKTPYKYEILTEKMFWYSEEYKIEFTKID